MHLSKYTQREYILDFHGVVNIADCAVSDYLDQRAKFVDLKSPFAHFISGSLKGQVRVCMSSRHDCLHDGVDLCPGHAHSAFEKQKLCAQR